MNEFQTLVVYLHVKAILLPSLLGYLYKGTSLQLTLHTAGAVGSWAMMTCFLWTREKALRKTFLVDAMGGEEKKLQ